MTSLDDIAEAVSAQMGIDPHVPMTKEQAAEFGPLYEAVVLARAQMADGVAEFHHHRDEAPLSPDEVRQLLRECVTVVKPGETLVVRLPPETRPYQARDMQDSLNAGWDEGDPCLPFRTVVIPAAELGVVEATDA